MNGTIALQGGSPFVGHDALDVRLLADAGASDVVVLPTADAFEDPDRLLDAARAWGERLGVSVTPARVLRRSEAADPDHVDVVSGARAVWLVGDSPMHLRSVLKDTPLWDALHSVLEAGGVVCGVGASGAALCDPMTDPRGGAFTLGLGLVTGLAFVPEAESQTPERLQRTLKIANVPVAVVASDAALVRAGDAWEQYGDVTLHGALPT